MNYKNVPKADQIQQFYNNQSDSFSELNSEHEKEIDVSGVEPLCKEDQLYQYIKNSMNSLNSLMTLANDVYRRHDTALIYSIISSDLCFDFFNIINSTNNNLLFSIFGKLIRTNSGITREAVHKGILPLIFRLIERNDNTNIHTGMKMIRMIIFSGFLERIYLYGFGIYDLIWKMCVDDKYNYMNEKACYVAKTIFYFIKFDPVYSSFGYSHIGGVLPKRSCVIKECRNVGFDQKQILKVSNFLKHGNHPKINKKLHHIIGFLLKSENIKNVQIGFKIIAEMTTFSSLFIDPIIQFYYSYCSFKKYIKCNDTIILSQIMLALSQVVYFTGSQYKFFLKKINSFQFAYKFILEDKPELQFYAARFLINSSPVFKDVLNKCSNKKYFSKLINKINDSDFQTRNEIYWLIINILSLSETKISLLSNETINCFFDLLDQSDSIFIEPILNLFICLCETVGNDFINILRNENFVEYLHNICLNSSKEITNAASTLLNEILFDEKKI